jgi:hypothetical protein
MPNEFFDQVKFTVIMAAIAIVFFFVMVGLTVAVIY